MTANHPRIPVVAIRPSHGGLALMDFPAHDQLGSTQNNVLRWGDPTDIDRRQSIFGLGAQLGTYSHVGRGPKSVRLVAVAFSCCY